MDRQNGFPAAHSADRDVVAHTFAQIVVEFTVDICVDVAAIAEVVEVHHARRNPTSTRMLPME